MVGSKILIVANLVRFIALFGMDDAKLLQSLGFEVHCAANCSDIRFLKLVTQQGIIVHHIDFPRSPYSKKTILSLKQFSDLVNLISFAAIHSHTPVPGIVSRLCTNRVFRKNLAKKPAIIYTAHGFHFYKGAPLLNWLIYFPFEWYYSFFTDILITINNEDYKRAQKLLHAKSIYKIPGIGIKIDKITHTFSDEEIKELCDSLSIKPNEIVFVSVGDLNKNKNHMVGIRALAKLNNQSIKYFICGEGPEKRNLEKLIKQQNLEKQVFLLGFRMDIPKILSISDVFLIPSLREGLSISLMEAMAIGLPCLVSEIRGNVDLITEGQGGYFFDPRSTTSLKTAMLKLIHSDFSSFGDRNRKNLQKFDRSKVEQLMIDVYQNIIKP